MIGAYVRVSSRHQKADSQRAEITKWLESNGIDLGQVAWYEDKESGKSRQVAGIAVAKKRGVYRGLSTVTLWRAWPPTQRVRIDDRISGE